MVGISIAAGRLALRTNHSPVTRMSHMTRTASRKSIDVAYKVDDDPLIASLGNLHDDFDGVRLIVIRNFYPRQPESCRRGRDGKLDTVRLMEVGEVSEVRYT